jgi:hypothetical protein
MYGIGSMANTPKRPGFSAISSLVYSLDSRATRAASAGGRKLTCGVVRDTMAVAVPALSISSSERCTVHAVTGGVSRPAFFNASNQVGGTMWWCMSMRCSVSFAKARLTPKCRRVGDEAAAAENGRIAADTSSSHDAYPPAFSWDQKDIAPRRRIVVPPLPGVAQSSCQPIEGTPWRMTCIGSAPGLRRPR